MYREIHTPEDHLKLQSDLNALETWANTWGMRFNAKKCNIMQICRTTPSNFFYQLCGQILEEVDECKYLGVTIRNDLKWESQVNSVCNKGNRTLGFLRRNLKYSPQSLKEQAYISLVRSSMEYSATVWNPYLQKDIDNLHKIEKRAARFITNKYSNTYSMTEIFDSINWVNLKERRRDARLCLMYKIVNGVIAVDMNDYLIKGDARTRAHNDLKLQQITVNTTGYQHSFFPDTIPIWNNLPQEIINKDSVDTFRKALKAD